MEKSRHLQPSYPVSVYTLEMECQWWSKFVASMLVTCTKDNGIKPASPVLY